MFGGKMLRRCQQMSSDSAPLLFAMNCDLPNVQGVWCNLPVQESDDAMTLHFRNEGNAVRDKAAMLFL